MNEIILISMVDVSGYGVRCLSSFLLSQGRTADILTLRLSDNRKNLLSRKPIENINNKLFEYLIPFVSKYKYIGLSLFTDSLNECITISKEIKNHYPNKVIIWGGIHPTVKPEECLKYADYICIGEGYYSLDHLLKKLDGKDFLDRHDLPQGIWSKDNNGRLLSTGASKVCHDVDLLPFPNYEENHSYVRNNDNTITTLDRAKYNKYLDYVYYTMVSIGCPNSCTYCCNNALKKLSKEYIKIRNHSVNYIISEIKDARNKVDFYNVYFMDDSFILTDSNLFEEFVERYPKEIGLPFIATGMIPRILKQSHVDKLIQAGMIRSRVGIQTASSKMLKIYNRKQSNEDIIKVSNFFSKYTGKIVPLSYDIILDGYDEDINDKIETVRLISKLARPLILNLTSLRPYPGTEISEKYPPYVPGESVPYTVWENNVINNLIGIMPILNLPHKILSKVIARKGFLEKKVPSFVSKIVYYSILVQKTLYHLYYGEYSSKPKWLVDIIEKIKRKK